MIELPGTNWLGLEQPQWVSRWKLNFFRRNLLPKKIAAVTATMLKAVISCQSMRKRYSETARAQPDVWKNPVRILSGQHLVQTCLWNYRATKLKTEDSANANNIPRVQITTKQSNVFNARIPRVWNK